MPTFTTERMDPTRATSPDMPYWGNSFDFLMGMDENGNPTTENGAASSVVSSPDGKVWTIELREGMKFHDGVEVTAEDVAFSLELYASEDAACSSCGKMQSNLDFVTVTGTYSLDVTFIEPNALFLRDLTRVNDTLAIIPKHHWEAVGGADGFNENPLGSGPYVFSERAIGEFIEFTANTDYWNADRVPGFETLHILLAPEATSRLALLERGDVDLALMDPFLAPDVLAAGLEITGPKRVQTIMVAFGMPWKTEFFYNDQAAREALIQAVDIAAIVGAIYPEGTASVAASFAVVPSQEGYDPDLVPYEYDPDAAAQAIQDLGLVGQEIIIYQYSFGFRGHATRRSPGKPLVKSNVHDMFRNRYYIGIVTWDGIDYEGRHEPLIDLDTFETVQQLLTERNISGEKTAKHWHYLKGSIFCATCGSRLSITINKGMAALINTPTAWDDSVATAAPSATWQPTESKTG